MDLTKPKRLCKGDTIATISPCWGCAGNDNMLLRYNLGKQRLQSLFGLNVIPAPNSMRGEEYLSLNPRARAEDVMWAFENKNVKAIIANIGGNDSIKVVLYISKEVISNNPKIFIGYSDVLFLHLYATSKIYPVSMDTTY